MSIYRIGTYRKHGKSMASVIATGKGSGPSDELGYCQSVDDAEEIVRELKRIEQRDNVLTRAMGELMSVVLTEPIDEAVKFKKMAEIVQGCSDELRGISQGGSSPLSELKEGIRLLSDEQRLDLFGDYCKYCGCYDADRLSRCQCWNDE